MSDSKFDLEKALGDMLRASGLPGSEEKEDDAESQQIPDQLPVLPLRDVVISAT